MDRVNFAFEAFKNQQELIKFADQKAGAILVVAGLLFPAYVHYLNEIKGQLNENFDCCHKFILTMGFISLISFLLVVYLTIFKILRPRPAKLYPDGDFSVLYSGHITIINKEIIYEKFSQIDKELMLKNVSDQICEVSMILEQKYKFIRRSFYWLALMIASVLMFIMTVNFCFFI